MIKKIPEQEDCIITNSKILNYPKINNKHFKNEKEFTTRFGREIRKIWWFWHKISDADPGYKPADAIAWYNNKAYLIEFKVWSEKKRTDVIKKLRLNQIAWLSKRYDCWLDAIIIYYNKYYNEYYVIKYKKQKQIYLNFHHQSIT